MILHRILQRGVSEFNCKACHSFSLILHLHELRWYQRCFAAPQTAAYNEENVTRKQIALLPYHRQKNSGQRKLNRPTSAEGIVFDSKLYHLSHSLSRLLTQTTRKRAATTRRAESRRTTNSEEEEGAVYFEKGRGINYGKWQMKRSLAIRRKCFLGQHE